MKLAWTIAFAFLATAFSSGKTHAGCNVPRQLSNPVSNPSRCSVDQLQKLNRLLPKVIAFLENIETPMAEQILATDRCPSLKDMEAYRQARTELFEGTEFSGIFWTSSAAVCAYQLCMKPNSGEERWSYVLLGNPNPGLCPLSYDVVNTLWSYGTRPWPQKHLSFTARQSRANRHLSRLATSIQQYNVKLAEVVQLLP